MTLVKGFAPDMVSSKQMQWSGMRVGKPKAFLNRDGSVLFLSLAMIAIAAIGVGALFSAIQQDHRITARAVVWKEALPLAEAGVEEALAHLNNLNGSTNLQTNGWILNTSTGTYQKQRTLGRGTFLAEISVTNPPVIRSRGSVPTPLQTNFLSRTIVVKTMRGSFPGIEATDTIDSSTGLTDSFDSTDPAYSTGGMYDATKAKDNARFATLSGAAGKIDVGNRKIYGYVATGASGTVKISSSGKVGSKPWILRNDTNGKIEPGRQLGYTATFPPNSAPFSTGLTPPGPVAIGPNTYRYVLGNGDYKLKKLALTGKEQAIVTGKARLLVTDDFSLSGQSMMIVNAGASLEIYLACTSLDITGNGFLNNKGTATSLKIFGLPSLTSMKFAGDGNFIGVINAPNAVVKLTGSSAYYGHLKCYSADLSGGNYFHGDEAVCPKVYGILSWKEVP